MASDGRSSAMVPLAGVELGGTKCIVTLAHGPGAILDQHNVATTIPAETLPAIVAVLDRWHRTQGFGALGIASFGPLGLDPRSPRHGRILNTPKPGWSGADVLATLTSSFGVPTGLDTDVNGAALAEMRWGCAQGLDDFAYVKVGTGIGVGLIVHGRPTRGIGHSEIGHLRLPRTPGDHLPSVCAFHPDCVEGLASGTALGARLGGRAMSEVTPDDPIWVPIVSALAAMCHSLLCTTGPRRIAIGGGVVSGQPHLLARIEARVRLSLNGYLELPDEPIVVAPSLGAYAGPLGSIELAARALAAAAGGDR